MGWMDIRGRCFFFLTQNFLVLFIFLIFFIILFTHTQEIWASPYATAAFPDYAETLPEMGATDVSMSSSAQLLQQMAQTHKIWIVGGSLAERDGDKVYNTCFVFDPDGVVVAKHRKVHLFDIDVPGGITFTESDTLSAGNTITSFTTPWGQVGLGICYDLRFTGYAAALRQHHHCRILVYPGAFNLTTGPAHWELLQRARAVDTQCYVLTASQSRLPEAPTTEDNPTTSTTTGTRKYPYYAAWGHSSVTSPWGQVVATTNETPSVVVTDLDLDLIDQTRQAIPIGVQARTDLYQVVTTTTTSADSSRKATA